MNSKALQYVNLTSNNKKFIGFQVEAIKELKKAHPNGRFWLKVDACDIKVALQESVKGKWDGDIDLGDGKLQEMWAEYDARRTEACIKDTVVTRDSLELKICNTVDALKTDQEFLADGLKKADSAFQKKFNSPNASQAMLKALCWERVEYNTLLQQAQAFRATIDNLLTHLQPGCARVQDVASSLKDLQEDLQKYLRNLFVKKRQPAATHVLAILISEERRNKKPYAIPVQFVPYCSIRDQYIRDVTAKVKTEMVKMDLKPVGRLHGSMQVGFRESHTEYDMMLERVKGNVYKFHILYYLLVMLFYI